MKLDLIIGECSGDGPSEWLPPMWCYVEETHLMEADGKPQGIMHKRFYLVNARTCKDYSTPTELGRAMTDPHLSPKEYELTHKVNPKIIKSKEAYSDGVKALFPEQHMGGPIKLYRPLNASEQMELRVEMGQRELL